MQSELTTEELTALQALPDTPFYAAERVIKCVQSFAASECEHFRACLDSDIDDLRALLASAARAAELEVEVAEWRECMQFDALMSGPVFKGWDRSQMERCRKKHEARAALKEPK